MPFYKTYSPSANLQGIIRELQLLHVRWLPGEELPPPFITCLANTEQNIYFFPRDPIQLTTSKKIKAQVPPVVVTGPKTKPVGLLYDKNYLMIKVAFQPTGTYRLLNIAMTQTVNNGLDATCFWGKEIADILYALQTMNDYDEMIYAVTKFLEQKAKQQLKPAEPIDEVAIKMLDPLQGLTLEEWASMACLSLRQFERNFVTRVGISPKMFMRIVRFEYAIKIKNIDSNKSWAQIALECGYTDSAHILKEFKAFAEFPPSEFFLSPTSGYSELPTG
jgi:AraC-like DNA-binding protein